MTETNECRCGRPVADAFVCSTCSEHLSRALGDCAWLDDELDTTITRQRGAGTTGGAPSAERGLPWHDKAAEAKRTLHGLLVMWVRFCTEEGVRGLPSWTPRDNLPSLSRWLLYCVNGLSVLDIGPEAVDELTDAVAECERIVFWKRTARVYLGTCDQTVTDEDGEVVMLNCPGDVYAEEGDQVGKCEVCGQGVTVVIRKEQIDKRMLDHLFTPAEIATCAVHLGLDAPREKVRNRVNYWHRHKRIAPKSTAPNGDPLFRYGDVRGLLYAEFATRSA